MHRVPDHVPIDPGKTVMDWLAPHLPLGNGKVYLSLWLRVCEISPGIHRVAPWLTLYADRDDSCFALRLFPLPGAKIVELWDPETERWLEYQ